MHEISYLAGDRTAIVVGDTMVLLDGAPDAEFATTLWGLLSAGLDHAQLRDVLTGFGAARLPDFGLAVLASGSVMVLLRGSVRATAFSPVSAEPTEFAAESYLAWSEHTVAGASELRLWAGHPAGASLPLVTGMARADAVSAVLTDRTRSDPAATGLPWNGGTPTPVAAVPEGRGPGPDPAPPAAGPPEPAPGWANDTMPLPIVSYPAAAPAEPWAAAQRAVSEPWAPAPPVHPEVSEPWAAAQPVQPAASGPWAPPQPAQAVVAEPWAPVQPAVSEPWAPAQPSQPMMAESGAATLAPQPAMSEPWAPAQAAVSEPWAPAQPAVSEPWAPAQPSQPAVSDPWAPAQPPQPAVSEPWAVAQPADVQPAVAQPWPPATAPIQEAAQPWVAYRPASSVEPEPTAVEPTPIGAPTPSWAAPPVGQPAPWAEPVATSPPAPWSQPAAVGPTGPSSAPDPIDPHRTPVADARIAPQSTAPQSTAPHLTAPQSTPAAPEVGPPVRRPAEPIAEVFVERAAAAPGLSSATPALADVWVTEPTQSPWVPTTAVSGPTPGPEDALWVTPHPAPVASGPPAPGGPPPAGYLNARDNQTASVPAEAFGQVTSIAQVAPPTGQRPSLWAVRCPMAHVNPPGTTVCRVCDLVVKDQELAIVPRPPLGLLDFGALGTIALDSGLLIGQEPGNPNVDGVVPVRITHPSLSARHLEVRLHDWMVIVIDLGSAHGTTIQLPARPPQALRGHDPVPIPPGTVVWLANQVPFTYRVAP